MAGPEPILTEQVSDNHGTYEQQWYCEPPGEGVSYMVTRCTWTADHGVRKIYEVKAREAL